MEMQKHVIFHMFDKEGNEVGNYLAVFPYIKFKGQKHYSTKSRIMCLSGHILHEFDDQEKTEKLMGMLEYNVIFAHSLAELVVT